MKIHIWNLCKPSMISVDIREHLKDRIKNQIKDNMYEIACKLKINPSRLYEYFIYRKSAIPLIVLLKLSKIINIKLLDIENNIILYKQSHVPRQNSIKNPKLPVEIHPYLTSVVANLFFDGSVPNDGKGTYYNQKSEEIMNDFINKIKFIFGDVNYSIRRDQKGVLKCSVPRIIGEICKKIYKIQDFGTHTSRISNFIFNLTKEHKIAFVASAIIDEGSITYDGQIMFGVCNKFLCEGVKNLCNDIGLKTTKVNQKSKSDYYYFYIKSKEKLLEIIKFLNEKYPILSLRYKEERLKKYFEIKKHPGLRTKEGGDFRKRMIIDCIKKNPMSTNQLSIELLIPPRSLRRHILVLLDTNKIRQKKKGRNYVYFAQN